MITIIQMLLGVIYAVAILGRGFSLISRGKDVLEGTEANEAQRIAHAAAGTDHDGSRGDADGGAGGGSGDGGGSGGGGGGQCKQRR